MRRKNTWIGLIVILLTLTTLSVNLVNRRVIFYKATFLFNRGVYISAKLVRDVYLSNKDVVKRVSACDNNVSGKVLRFAFVLKEEITQERAQEILDEITAIAEAMKPRFYGRENYEVFFCVDKTLYRAYVRKPQMNYWYEIPDIAELLTWENLKVMLRKPQAVMYSGMSSWPIEERVPHLPDADGTYRAW
jgi:hypothetical protein